MKGSHLISTALSSSLSVCFFRCYLELKSVDNIIPFPEQIQPCCIVPYVYGWHHPTPIILHFFSTIYTKHEKYPKLKSTPSLLDELLGGTGGPAPEHAKCIKLPLYHKPLLPTDLGDCWQFTVFSGICDDEQERRHVNTGCYCSSTSHCNVAC